MLTYYRRFKKERSRNIVAVQNEVAEQGAGNNAWNNDKQNSIIMAMNILYDIGYLAKVF